MRRLAAGATWLLVAAFTLLMWAAAAWADSDAPPPESETSGKTIAIVVVGVAVVLVGFVSWRVLRKITKSRVEWGEAADERARHRDPSKGGEI